MAAKPLAPKQRQAAEFVGAGHSLAEAAHEVRVSTRTIRRWAKREDFAAAVKRASKQNLDEHPSARAALEAALQATHSNGKADHRTRVAAARALLPLETTEDDKVTERVTTVYLDSDDDDG